MLGGLYLCFEGVEKLAHKFLHSEAEDAAAHARELEALADSAVDVVALEREKIKGAVRTDFVLSTEIIVIALGTVAEKAFSVQVAVLAGVGIIMTVGVYGIVAGIVKIDDLGLHLSGKTSAAARAVGGVLLAAAPRLMKALSVIGTVAMFMVGGGILVHGVPVLHHAIEQMGEVAGAEGGLGFILRALTTTLLDILTGVAAGALALLAFQAASKARGALRGR